MRNCLIMGFGRSGTSLMAGMLHQSGFFLGDDLYPTRESNPFGFFENAFINGINEGIMRDYDYRRLNENSPVFSKKHSPYSPGEGQRWLSIIEKDVTIDHCSETIRNNIRDAVKRPGFAYKDPRFNYTFGIWKELMNEDTMAICMFRQPGITVGSVLKECGYAPYLSEFYIDKDLAYHLWLNSYTHLLKNLSSISADRVLFIHYEQLLTGEIVSTLSRKLEGPINSSFINQSLNRSKSVGKIPLSVHQMYDNLCDLSGFRN